MELSKKEKAIGRPRADADHNHTVKETMQTAKKSYRELDNRNMLWHSLLYLYVDTGIHQDILLNTSAAGHSLFYRK